MKKWMWGLLVIVLLLVAAGGVAYYKFAKSSKSSSMMEEERGGVFNTIQDALAKNLSLQCKFTSDGGLAATAYIKSGSVRVDTKEGLPDASSMIMKDKKIYFWQVAQKTGTVMTIPSITVTPVPTSASAESNTPTGSSQQNEGQNTLAMLEKFKDACKVAVVADSLFVPPTDVKFTDMSQMMKQMMPSGAPSGAPTGMSQEQVKQMMQQYGAPTGY